MFKSSHVLAIIVAIGVTGAVAVACGGSDDSSEGTTCDPAVSNCDGADATVPTAEIGAGGMYPPGSTVLPDGAVVLPDGQVVGPGTITGCVPGATACTNCKDDDGDGLIDWLDPECTGPLDNDESSFATGIPGDNIDPCKQDCWFDGNSGSGNDGCMWDARCLVGSKDPKCPYDEAAAKDPKQCPPPSDKCVKYCKPLTPKGCDCAGCCDVYKDGKAYSVKLVGECTYETLEDPTKCPPCGKIPECSNPCGKCDFCLGKLTLPDDCYPPKEDAGVDAPPPDAPITPPTSCPPESPTTCSPTKACPEGFYCLTGCCIQPPK